MHNIFELCCEGYDKLLERQFQKPDRTKKKVYICSPFSDPDPDKQRDNMRRARLYMLYANEHMGYLARAPHAYLPMLVCDRIPAERAMALRFGLELLEMSDSGALQQEWNPIWHMRSSRSWTGTFRHMMTSITPSPQRSGS